MASANAGLVHDGEDPEYVWLIWEGEGFVPFVAPALGGQVTIPAINDNRVLGME